MEQINNYNWAQAKLDQIESQELEGYHVDRPTEHTHRVEGENRAQRRERERQERKAAKRGLVTKQ